jgi:hypothetical protein
MLTVDFEIDTDIDPNLADYIQFQVCVNDKGGNSKHKSRPRRPRRSMSVNKLRNTLSP